MSDIINVLTTARNLIKNPKNWCQYLLYDEDEDGTPHFCVRGAIYTALNATELDESDIPYCIELDKDIEVENSDGPKFNPISKNHPHRDHVAWYNNNHTHAQTIALFDRTIARLKRQQIIDTLVTPTVESSMLVEVSLV